MARNEARKILQKASNSYLGFSENNSDNIKHDDVFYFFYGPKYKSLFTAEESHLFIETFDIYYNEK